MSSRRLACGLLIGGVTVAAAAFPGMAAATDYHVPPASGQAFADALNNAKNNPGPDRIFLGKGFYTAPVATGFEYYKPGDPVEIIGTARDGWDATIISGQLDGSISTLRLFGGPGTSIRDLQLNVPINAAAGTDGLRTDGVARDIRVFAKDAQQTNSTTGVVLYGGTLEDSIVDVGVKQTTGVLTQDSGGTVRGSSVSAYVPVNAVYGGVVERSRLAGVFSGVTAYRAQTIVRSSQIQLSGAADTRAIDVRSATGADDTVLLDGTTILGPGGPQATGVWADNSFDSSSDVKVTLTNSVLRGFAHPLRADGGGPGSVDIVASYSDYAATGNIDNAQVGGISESAISNVGDGAFAGPGDYHLTAGSPLVDAGDPAAPQGLDLDGNPLVADGNHDGSARRDIGAYELPGPPSAPPGGGGQQADTQAPVLSGFASTKRKFAKSTRFRFTLSEAAGVTIRIQRAVRGKRTRYRTVGTITRKGQAGANRVLFKGRIGKRLLRSGRYRAIALATDAAKNRSAPRRAGFRIAR